MKARERFDKILHSCRERIQEEVSALVGKPFKLGEPTFRQVSKEELFADTMGKQVLARIRLEGEHQGEGCLMAGIKDAIYIGGTLIMLPESELESVLAEQEYSEELQDSYGEIANIICGSATVTFEEQYPKPVRLVRTEQEVINPVKVVVESAQPIADIPYYCMVVPMQMDSRVLGSLLLVLPAVPFGLVEVTSTAKAQPQASEGAAAAREHGDKDVTQQPVETLEREASAGAVEEQVGVLHRPAAEAKGASGESEKTSTRKRDIVKQKKLVDDLLNTGTARMAEEVSALLGGTLKVLSVENLALTKAEFLDQAGGKQIMTRMDIRGGGQGEAYLFVDVKSAVLLGGALIMLPEEELEETVRNEDFGDDARDAYGEVTNIIAGVYTSAFEERYNGKLGFVKTAMEPVTPVKIVSETDDVFVNQAYYLTAGTMEYNGRDLGRLQLLIPARVLELEELLVGEESAAAGEVEGVGVVSGGKPAAAAEPVRIGEKPAGNADVLLFTDDDNEAGRITDVLAEMGYGCRTLHFKDSVNSVLTPRIQMVFLVMQEASEQGFGVAIKISSAGLSVPLVAAGPTWTRTMVLKAVKYGACDILITPSSPDDIREKIENNLAKKAA
jgi:chemotaxis protein CheY-P-specific phosphatase CheC